MRSFSEEADTRAPHVRGRSRGLMAAGLACVALLMTWAVVVSASPAQADADDNSPQAACPPDGRCFADVPSGSSFYEFVNRIYEQDIVTGYPCGGAGEPCDAENRPYYRPVAGVTRQQMAKFVDQARRQPGIYIDTTTHDRPIYAHTTKSTGVGVYGVSDYGVGVYGESASGGGVYGESTAAHTGHGVTGVSDCASCYGVYGSSDSGNAVYGSSTSGYGVSGNAPSGTGVSGSSTSGFGVAGISTSGTGVVGGSNAASNGRGVYGSANCATCSGVFGTSANGDGVVGGSTSGDGVSGSSNSTTNGNGVAGVSNCQACSGAYGSSANGRGVYGTSTNNYGVLGESAGGNGVAGYSTATTNGNGVLGVANCATCRGVWGNSILGSAVYGSSTNGWAGYFSGNVNVTGTCCGAGAGLYRIDHPLDPQNRYLYHSAVESPDMKTVYDGIVTTDAAGNAKVVLPRYVEALNRDFRYQLTVIGDFAQAVVSQEISGNQFTIKTDKPNVKVSWQVTGIRKDPFAEYHRVQVEVEKSSEEQGKYLHPVEYGYPARQGVNYEPAIPDSK